ncbi:MAG: site-specific DNA-methyltransferase [Bacteriovoracales bacterium]|nr:site-specific DNA-methyltransferase [Bacteriovoracales bacterium]
MAANRPIAKALRPQREESVNFDTTQNLFIEGDNLDALKLLQESYLGKVKMIYIDPPYNTGNDFIYKDNFAQTTEEYLVDSSQKNGSGERLVANTDSNGRFHSDWCSMMYSRLKVARNLLRDDGVVVIHIDEHEHSNVQKLLDELFGSHNCIGTIVWDKRNPKGDAKGIACQHELIIFYCRNKATFQESCRLKIPKENAHNMLEKVKSLMAVEGMVTEKVRKEYKIWLKRQSFSEGEKAYCYIDNSGKVYRPVSMAWPNKKKAPSDYFIPLVHPDTKKECPVPTRGWRYTPTSIQKLLENDLVLFGKNETTQPTRKYLLSENMHENFASLLYYGGSDDKLLSKLGIFFETPKPIDIAKKIIASICKGNEIVCDFFSGSATTAHAAMQLNAEDGGNRKFIMVQIPEKCTEDSEAFKNGYKTIAEIGKERIRRAGAKIKKENPDIADKLDTGFRAFKIDSSNMNKVHYYPHEYTPELFKSGVFSKNIKDDRSPEDLVFHVMLDWGVPFDLPIVKKDISGREVFFVGDGELAMCFASEGEVTKDFAKDLLEHGPLLRLVFRDAGFKDDCALGNVRAVFKCLSPQTEMRVI